MLERMYTRWAQAMGYSTRTLDRAAGEEAGLKSVELEVTGIFAGLSTRGATASSFGSVSDFGNPCCFNHAVASATKLGSLIPKTLLT
eukprot:scaffold178420_cov18-Tisochrysis_lutea.AAC.1